MTTLKLTQIGNSVGLILPEEILTRLKFGKGDCVFVTDAPGRVTLMPYDADFELQMATARSLIKKRRNVLRELAK